MKNKIIVFAIAMLLPGLTWACGGEPTPFDIMKTKITNWIAISAILTSLVALIAVSLALAFEKNKENKKLRWAIILTVAFFVFNSIFFHLYESTIGLIFYIALPVIIMILDLVCIKNKKDKRLKWWIIIAIFVLISGLLALIINNAMANMLCGGSADF
jgi:4-amino-4-deoxy-L-arabinose transferase-like glycosyltransferase